MNFDMNVAEWLGVIAAIAFSIAWMCRVAWLLGRLKLVADQFMRRVEVVEVDQTDLCKRVDDHGLRILRLEADEIIRAPA